MSRLQPAAALAAWSRRVWGEPPQAGGSPPKATPRPPSRATSLPFQQAKNLINALAFAEAALPAGALWAHATIVVEQSEGFDASDPRAYLARQGRILCRVRDWLRSRGLPAHWLWARELGPRYGMAHTHVLLPLPPELRGELAGVIRRAGRLHDLPNNRAVVVQTNGDRGVNTPAARAGVLRDLLKTMAPKARLDGVPIMPALGVRHRAPCAILGKRSGTSESLSRTARARAGWRELETLAELHAALPTGEEARKERHRAKQRRRRARRRAGIASVPQPTRCATPHRQEPDPFADDLAADFFEGV